VSEQLSSIGYLQKIKKLIINSDYQKTGQELYDNPPQTSS